MSLSSIPFLFGALPIFLLLYYLSKPKFRIYELLAFSAWFYYVNEPDRLKFIIALILANYVIAICIWYFKQNLKIMLSKSALIVGIVGNTLLLFVYKYLTFTVGVVNASLGSNLVTKDRALLVGQSFFTFAIISYLVDVYTDKCRVQKNVIKFADYILMFPKIIMGPIARYADMENDFESLELKLSDIGMGAKRFMCGFCKKTILADNLALLVSEVNINFSNNSIVALWIGSIAYSLQLLFDFSGYTDMAIGMAQMLGFHIKENFNYPYCCKSFTDFWRRWHISLSEWFRDYIYIPLGGSRKLFIRNLFNLLIVWVLTGIWHGAGYAFIAWGLVYFLMLVLERYIIKPNRLGMVGSILWRIVTLLIINFNWVLFSHEGLKTGLNYCLQMIGLYHKNDLMVATDIRLLREYGLYLLLGIVFTTPIAKLLEFKVESENRLKSISAIVIPILYLLALMWGMSFVMLGFHNPFMYQQF